MERSLPQHTTEQRSQEELSVIREQNRYNPKDEEVQVSEPDTLNNVSNFEWLLVICTLLLTDIIQFLLDGIAIGAVLNRFIDLFVGIGFSFYLQLQGQSLGDPRRLIALITTFIGEEIPVVDILPFWTFDGLYNWYLYYTAHGGKLENIPGVKMGLKIAKYIPETEVLAKTAETAIKMKERVEKKNTMLFERSKETVENEQSENSRNNPNSNTQNALSDTTPVLFKNNQNSTLSDVRKEMRDQEQSQNLTQNNDALDQLNNKQGRSDSENRKLIRAFEIMERHSISNAEKTDPVYIAAWNKVQSGIRPYNALNNRNGYKFSNIQYIG